VSLIYFVLCAYGLTQILVYATILKKIRPAKGSLGKLFSCPMCMGFWVGVFLWALNDTTELFSFDESLVTGFLLGCLSSATSYVLNMLFGDNGLKIEHNGVSFKKKTNYRRWK